MKPNPNFYLQKINQIVKDTEEIGETMNPNYEEIRALIDEGKSAELTEERQLAAVEVFKEGTAKYRDLLKSLSSLRAPARIMGVHKKFERAYQTYVDGCEDMIESIANGIDIEAFDVAEQKQDEATDAIAASLQKMTSLLM
ncbi:hypothetical protein LQF61_08570 [Tetragenococcus koreensis]|uniref:Uncharacterized protein n=1 Tax=Tetragenococcus koreensis TaxID=290335 RepID=A0AAN4UC33_9ENTE|nr:hypothetical protein [Tetragenococcus koreensis]AYW45719.1 hypothetical protein C7K43_07025 [Tetragenococcus koreensis]MCF1585536.1 hypothetical protein [Tetragenococcus koreensis]MCF1615082.1 hypothetical protein [Tetragenococcus koreensis]MCF1620127.1 hypothetical protein [Tetragenococcus koreensis]MCF1624910.1 hypothetical protein [Tetragenococcus koreensis]